MGWAGGTYTKGNNSTGGWTGDASLGIGIEAGRHDTQDNDFATGINQCLNKDGSNAATADLPMGGFKHTNVANATGRTNYAAVGQVQDGDFIWLGTVGGTATALTANAAPAITAYKAGQKFRMITAAGSTGSVATAHTLAINGLASPKNIVNNEDSTNPTVGTWVSGALMELVYDGTNFRITNDPGGWLTFAPNLRSGTATLTTPAYPIARFRKQGKVVTIIYNFTFAITVSNNTILYDAPTEIADTGTIYVQNTMLNLSGGSVKVAQSYVVSGREVTILHDALGATGWIVTAAPNAVSRGMLVYRSV